MTAAVGIVGPGRIDEINILQATYEAMRQAVGKLSEAPGTSSQRCRTNSGYYASTGSHYQGRCQECIRCRTASILAKVTRDRLMYEYDKIMPEYGFAVQ